LKIANQSSFSYLQPASLLSLCHRRSSAARRSRPSSSHLLLAELLHVSLQSSPPPFAFALELSPHCHAPRSTRRSPPHCRRGTLRIEPGSPISHTHQNQGALLDLVPSLSRRFANPRPRTPPAITIATAEQGLAVEPTP